MKQYDVVIIGGGPGGYVSALRLAKLGKKVALVEKKHLGGTCLNYGCIPTKALIAGARVADTLKEAADFGFTVGQVSADYGKAVDRSRQVVGQLTRGVAGLMRKNGVDVIMDRAIVKDAHTVTTTLGGDIQAGAIVIATGSSARKLGVLQGIPNVMTAQEALVCKEMPKRLAIIGAGVIGMEFAYVYSAYGCQVTMVEAVDRVLPGFDKELSSFARETMEQRGVTIHTSVRMESAKWEDGEIRLECKAADGSAVQVACDSLLCSIGVMPNTQGLGLENAGVELDERGYVRTNCWMQTNVPSIYAIGDVNGKMPLAHAASAQGITVANLLGGADAESVDNNRVPRCVYCEPELAAIGVDEDTLKKQGAKYVVGRFSFGGNGKALADGKAVGFIKVLADAETLQVLGVHMAGPHVGEMIPQCEAMLRLEVTADELLDAVYPHPALSEALWEAVNDAAGQAIHK